MVNSDSPGTKNSCLHVACILSCATHVIRRLVADIQDCNSH